MFRKTPTSNARVAIFKNADFSRALSSYKIEYILAFLRPASARFYKIGVAGNNWLVGWLVGNAVFSKVALRIFLIFCMTLGDYKGRKVTEPDF